MKAENVVAPSTQANSSQQDQQVDDPGHGGVGGSEVRLPKLQLLKSSLICERPFEDPRRHLSIV